MSGIRPLTARPLIPVVIAGALLVSCADQRASPDVGDSVPRLNIEVLSEQPFDETSFTQGLEVDEDGSLLVGTGLEGESRIYRVEEDGQVTDSHGLDPDHFGEGITRHGDSVWQLTWQSGVALERDAVTLEEKNRVLYHGEGWGICSFDNTLVHSDGTDTLQFRDPETFEVTGTRSVTSAGTPITQINELECVETPESGREVWANIWYSDEIVRIDPETGEVTAIADASALREMLPDGAESTADVLNGIAHIPGTDRYFLTGKLWPTLFEVRFTSENSQGNTQPPQ
ncbi:glutaminyl-peptide cyclotransferase [Corynebacterium sputi]|uniref:glutaminyl-peptide cyclotransferase n=1 Tax=Corynebacterium sputi TaxID=489915 RepID=UPI000401FE6A|nr:glutaminyl-peptide cyclotransferase [Corynebacterium sputi]